MGAFAGLSPATFRDRDTLPDPAKFFHVGSLVRQVRNAEGLTGILRHFFRVPVRIEEFVGHWMALGPGERTYLQPEGACLGRGAVLGGRVWDRQHKFRVHVGPLSLAEYHSFLPGSPLLRKLVDWVRLYLGFELDWDVRLALARTEVPPLSLDGRTQLGWTTWLGRRRAAGDAADLYVDAERFVDPA